MPRSTFTFVQAWFARAVLAHRVTTFVVMGLAFFVFGAGTLNLFMLLRTNVELVSDYGWQALEDGALAQFVELLVTGYLSMLGYIVFKACESKLVKDLLGGDAHAQLDVAADRPAQNSSEAPLAPTRREP